jgi:hypothetical protein
MRANFDGRVLSLSLEPRRDLRALAIPQAGYAVTCA